MGTVAWRRYLRSAVSCRSYESFARGCETAILWHEGEEWLIAAGHFLKYIRTTPWVTMIYVSIYRRLDRCVALPKS